MSIIVGVAMKSEKVEPIKSSRGSPLEGGEGFSWSPEVTELLDHLALELAIEYVRLMEAAAKEEGAAPVETKREEV